MQDRLGLEMDDGSVEDEPQLTDVLLAMFDTMQSAIARYRLASYPPDVLIEIPANVCKTHEFYKARRLIAAGHYWTNNALTQHKDRLARSV